MPTPVNPTGTPAQRLAVIVLAPIVFVVLCDIVIRVSGVDTSVARNRNFEIGVPTWLLGDENWVDIQRGRMDEPDGVRAEDVAWLQHFEEARYIQYKLKPSIEVDASNPFNDIELRKEVTFPLRSNRDGFRTKEFAPRSAGVMRIVTIGDSSTFGWGVGAEHTYQRLLEGRFANAGDEVEVLNLGISGHTSRHGLSMFEHYVRGLDPDLLIISYGANDARYVLQSADDVLDADETWRGTARSLLYRFETFKLMRRLILSVYDPFAISQARADAEGTARALVRSVDRDVYMENLRLIVSRAREHGIDSALLAVCTLPAYVRGMRYIADTEQLPLVDAESLFRENLDALRSKRLYPTEVAFYENLYGPDALSARPMLYVTTDGCHPGRAGHSLIADALHEALRADGGSATH